MDTSVPEHSQPRMGFFPLMNLPLELRQKIYFEVLVPDQHHMYFDYGPRNVPSSLKGRGDSEKNRTNLLLANKQIYKESSQVLYEERFFKTWIDMGNIEFGGALSDSPCRKVYTPPRLPEIRNLEIYVNMSKLPPARFVFRHVDFKRLVDHFTLACYEIKSQCHNLRNLTITVPCQAYIIDTRIRRVQRTPVKADCIQVHEFKRLLRPLRMLRVSRNFTLRCHCQSTLQLKPVIDPLASVIRSSDPVERVWDDQARWHELRARAMPFLDSSSQLQHHLNWSFKYMRLHDERKPSTWTWKFWNELQEAERHVQACEEAQYAARQERGQQEPPVERNVLVSRYGQHGATR